MFTPAPPRTPATAHPSRQQLDELDALLQRMLALPVNRLEDNLIPGAEVHPPDPAMDQPISDSTSDLPAWTAPSPRGLDPCTSIGVSPKPAEASGTEDQELGQETILPAADSLPVPSSTLLLGPGPAARSEQASSYEDFGGARTTTPRAGTVIFVPTVSPPAAEQPARSPPQRDESALPGAGRANAPDGPFPALDTEGPPPAGWLRPLLWANRGFDCATASLGAPGCWLQSQRGRTVLGGIGLLLWALALALVVAAWIGWTR